MHMGAGSRMLSPGSTNRSHIKLKSEPLEYCTALHRVTCLEPQAFNPEVRHKHWLHKVWPPCTEPQALKSGPPRPTVPVDHRGHACTLNRHPHCSRLGGEQSTVAFRVCWGDPNPQPRAIVFFPIIAAAVPGGAVALGIG